MDCPHCGSENLLGARLCASCGKSMHAAPVFAAAATGAAGAPAPRPALRTAAGPRAPATPPPRPPAPSAETEQGLCRVCQQPFDLPPAGSGIDADAHVCPSCRAIAEITSAPSRGRRSEVLPESAEDAATRPAARRVREVPAHRRSSRGAKVAVVIGVLLVLAGAGAVVLRREPDHGATLVASARADAAAVALDGAAGFSGRLRTETRLEAARDEVRTAGLVARVLDLRQTTEHVADVAFVRADERGPQFDVASESRLVEQRGRIDLEDAATIPVFPFAGRPLPVRVRTGPGTPPVQLDGEAVSPGRDVPPFLHLGSLAPPSDRFAPGTKWRTKLRLPALCDGRGALAMTDVTAEISYAGTMVRDGTKCAAFRISGRAAPTVPAEIAETYPRATGEVSGAVWIDLATGLVQSADVEAQSRLWREGDGVEDDLRIRVRIVASRP